MTRDEILREIQKRIAEARGYTDVYHSKVGTLGVLHADEGSTLVPRWPQEWCEAGALVQEMEGNPYSRGSECPWFGGEEPAHQYRLLRCGI